MRPPTKNDPKLTQNGCKCMTFGASSLGLFGLTFPLNIVIGAKTLKHALHAKHHRMSVDRLSGHLGTWTYWTTQRHGGGLGACAIRFLTDSCTCEHMFSQSARKQHTDHTFLQTILLSLYVPPHHSAQARERKTRWKL